MLQQFTELLSWAIPTVAGRHSHTGQSNSCKANKSPALCCQPSMQMCLTGALARCSNRSAISRRCNVKFISALEYPNPANRLRTRRGIPAVMKALGPSRSYSPHPVITSPKSVRPEPPARALPAQQEILGDIFAGQDDRWRIQGDERGGIAQQIVQPVQTLSRQSETLMPRPASPDLLRDEPAPARFYIGKAVNRNTLHLRDGLADLRQDPLLLVFGQSGPRLGAENAGESRDDKVGPLIALALDHDFRNRDAKPSAKL